MTSTVRPSRLCCSPPDAWSLVADLAEAALAGDDYCRRLLPRAVDHALAIEQAEAKR